MIPRPTPPNASLRALLVELSAVPAWEARAQAGLLDLAALMSAYARKPAAEPLAVLRFIAAARQLADAVARGTVSEGNVAQARNLLAKGADVAQAVETWTEEGRVTPTFPPPRPAQ